MMENFIYITTSCFVRPRCPAPSYFPKTSWIFSMRYNIGIDLMYVLIYFLMYVLL